MKSTESDVDYFDINAVFSGEPVELLEKSAQKHKNGCFAASGLCIHARKPVLTGVRKSQLKTGGFCWSKALLLACPC